MTTTTVTITEYHGDTRIRREVHEHLTAAQAYQLFAAERRAIRAAAERRAIRAAHTQYIEVPPVRDGQLKREEFRAGRQSWVIETQSGVAAPELVAA